MSRMIADSKLLLDQLGHPPPRPDIAQKAIGFGSLVEEFDQLRELLCIQQRRTTGCGMILHCREALASSPRQPLADRTLGHAQSRSNMALHPSLLIECPGTLAATFVPTEGLMRICGAHTPQQSISRPTIIRS